MLGKMAMSASYDMVFLYAVEVFPTVTRSVGLGTCNMAAKVGSATAPYSALLVSFNPFRSLFLLSNREMQWSAMMG